MCIICVELEKSLISPLEARRNLAEMAFDLDLDHFLEVEEKIEEVLNEILIDKSDYLKKKENLKKLNYQNTWNNVNQKILKTINEN